MTFLDDELSVITGPYEDLLSLDEVIEQELILFVTLNVNSSSPRTRRFYWPTQAHRFFRSMMGRFTA
jgi:hypothetical protein